MTSLVAEHPDLMVFIVLMLILFFVIKLKSNNAEMQINDMMRNLNFKFKNESLDHLLADLSMVTVDTENVEQKNMGLSVVLVGDIYDKGYDYFYCEFLGKSPEVIPSHKHQRSSEFFHVLEGSLTIETELSS